MAPDAPLIVTKFIKTKGVRNTSRFQASYLTLLTRTINDLTWNEQKEEREC
jgi:hypothetical protein